MTLRNTLKRKAVTRAGAITLLLCLIFPAFTGLLLYGIGAAEYRVAEADTMRLAEAQLDILKGQFNRHFYDHFGLLANTAADPADALLPQWADLRQTESPSIRTAASLYDREQLARQIEKHMALRTPVLGARDVWLRLKTLYKDNYGSQLRTVLGEFDTPDAYDLIENPPLVPVIESPTAGGGAKTPAAPEPMTSPADNASDTVTDNPDDETTVDPDKAMEPVKDLVEEAERYLIPHYRALDIYDPEPCTVNGIVTFADKLDETVRDLTFPGMDKIVVHDYLMRYFTSAVPTLKTGDGTVHLQTPYGKQMRQLIDEGRTYEIEHLIFFAEDPYSSAQKAKNYISAVRFAERLIINGRNRTKRAIYKAEAGLVSGLVTVISLGSVNIPPVALEWLILIADSGIDAAADTDRLLKGKGVDSFIAPKKVQVYYTDYLRLMSLTLSRDTLLDRMIRFFRHRYGEQAATAFAVEVTFRGHTLSLEKGYVFD